MLIISKCLSCHSGGGGFFALHRTHLVLAERSVESAALHRNRWRYRVCNCTVTSDEHKPLCAVRVFLEDKRLLILSDLRCCSRCRVFVVYRQTSGRRSSSQRSDCHQRTRSARGGESDQRKSHFEWITSRLLSDCNVTCILTLFPIDVYVGRGPRGPKL